MFRRNKIDIVEFLLVHPGGPFWRNKDAGAWTIPKGEAADGEDLLERAKIEFEEELGIAPKITDPIDLESVRQAGGKVVHAWAFEGDLPADFQLRSNTFEVEWPPRTGKRESFPEVDRAEVFAIAEARDTINAAQTAFLDRRADALKA